MDEVGSTHLPCKWINLTDFSPTKLWKPATLITDTAVFAEGGSRNRQVVPVHATQPPQLQTMGRQQATQPERDDAFSLRMARVTTMLRSCNRGRPGLYILDVIVRSPPSGSSVTLMSLVWLPLLNFSHLSPAPKRRCLARAASATASAGVTAR